LADQEDQERNRYPKRNNDTRGKRNNDNLSDKGQRDYLGSSQNRKLDELIATVGRNLRGKKSRNQQELFNKILHKQLPMHPKSKHTLFECVSFRKSLNAPLPKRDAKKKDNEDDAGDKSEVQDYQHPVNVINVIFGGDSGFPTKRA
jgi:hypothetical protein